MTDLHLFRYRLPRYKTDFPIDLILGTTVLAGRCKDISFSGIQAELSHSVQVGASCLLVLKPGGRTFEFDALITHSDGLNVGLQFTPQASRERSTIKALIEAVNEGPKVRS